MENASKALLMAAGVLIGLLILSLAVFLFFNFAATSSELHDEIKQNQIHQFNAQFTSYTNKNDITFYDILTVVNLAKDNNDNNGFTVDSENNDYITVILNGTSIERMTQTELNNLLKANVDLPQYTCRVEMGIQTEKVKKVVFNNK